MLAKATLATMLSAAVMASACGCAAIGEGPWARRAQEPRAASAAGPEAQDLNEAVTLITNLQYAPAAEKLVGLLERLEASPDKDAPITAEATFWLGFCREKQQRVNDAVFLYNQVVERFPGTSPANMAEQRLREVAVPGYKP